VKLPILPDWNALHRFRVDVRDGRVEFDRLEHGLSKLPDAVLDFNLRDDRLCLDKDIPLVPFDRTTLLSWKLRGEEIDHAERGWIRLSHLLEPRVEVQRRDEDRDEGPRYLQELRIHDIDVALTLAPDAVVALPGGGSIQLGRAVKKRTDRASPAIAETRVEGEIVYRPDRRKPSGGVSIEADRVTLGLEGLPAGERKVDIPWVTADQLRAQVKTRDVVVQQVIVDVDDLVFEDVVVDAPA
jgi:hypothetical protein